MRNQSVATMSFKDLEYLINRPLAKLNIDRMNQNNL